MIDFILGWVGSLKKKWNLWYEVYKFRRKLNRLIWETRNFPQGDFYLNLCKYLFTEREGFISFSDFDPFLPKGSDERCQAIATQAYKNIENLMDIFKKVAIKFAIQIKIEDVNGKLSAKEIYSTLIKKLEELE